MKSSTRHLVKTILAAVIGGVAVGPLAALGLRSLFLLQGPTLRWVLILCTVAAAVAMGVQVWRSGTDRPHDRDRSSGP